MKSRDGEIEQESLKQQKRNKNVKRDEKPTGLILLFFALFAVIQNQWSRSVFVGDSPWQIWASGFIGFVGV